MRLISLRVWRWPSGPVAVVTSMISQRVSLTWRACPPCLTFSCLSGSLKKSLNVSLNLNVDAMRGISRGFFVQSDLSSRTLQQFVLLNSGISCFNFPIFMKVRFVHHRFRQSWQLRFDSKCCVCFSNALPTQCLLWRYDWISHKPRCFLKAPWLFLTSTAGRRSMSRWAELQTSLIIHYRLVKFMSLCLEISDQYQSTRGPSALLYKVSGTFKISIKVSVLYVTRCRFKGTVIQTAAVWPIWSWTSVLCEKQPTNKSDMILMWNMIINASEYFHSYCF